MLLYKLKFVNILYYQNSYFTAHKQQHIQLVNFDCAFLFGKHLFFVSNF